MLRPTVLAIQTVTPGTIPVVMAERLEDVRANKGSRNEVGLNETFRLEMPATQAMRDNEDERGPEDSEDEPKLSARSRTPGRGLDVQWLQKDDRSTARVQGAPRSREIPERE